jgi:hypothetical protein
MAGRICLPAFDAHNRQTEGCQPMVEHRRHPTGLEHDAPASGRLCQRGCDRLRRRTYVLFVNDQNTNALIPFGFLRTRQN